MEVRNIWHWVNGKGGVSGRLKFRSQVGIHVEFVSHSEGSVVCSARTVTV